MHASAHKIGSQFFNTYMTAAACRVLDVGSFDVNGTLRDCQRPGMDYTGVDLEAGPGVDIVLSDPYALPFGDGAFDGLVTTSTFEHAEFFWRLFTECVRVLKPGGYLYVNAPSNGAFHQYPFDFWRFYPDSGLSLRNWARREGHNVELIESAIAPQQDGDWNDFFAVFQKNGPRDTPSALITDAIPGCYNIRRFDTESVINIQAASEDRLRIQQAQKEIRRLLARETKLRTELEAETCRAAALENQLLLVRQRPFQNLSRYVNWWAASRLSPLKGIVPEMLRKQMSAVERKNCPATPDPHSPPRSAPAA